MPITGPLVAWKAANNTPWCVPVSGLRFLCCSIDNDNDSHYRNIYCQYICSDCISEARKTHHKYVPITLHIDWLYIYMFPLVIIYIHIYIYIYICIYTYIYMFPLHYTKIMRTYIYTKSIIISQNQSIYCNNKHAPGFLAP